jgi:kynurenine formamidase
VTLATSGSEHRELGRRLSNWGRWGDDDQIGTLNFISAEKRVEACHLVRTGEIVNLGIAFDSEGPQTGNDGRFNPIHRMSGLPTDKVDLPDGVIAADDMVIMPLQCATQWDSLAHIGYDGLLYNNVPAEAVNATAGATRNSFSEACDRLLSRGVLLDIAALRGASRLENGVEITAADLSAAEERQRVRVGSGDILLIRTGYVQTLLAGKKAHGDEPGLGVSTLEWLHDREVAAVAADNYGVEVFPSRIADSWVPFHMIAIRDIGLTLGELFNLERLAAACAVDGRFEFLFCGTGLRITGAVGSPVTPVAVR